MADNSDVEYYIEGVNFKDYGVYVSASSGLVGRLEQKERLQADWADCHGVVRDRGPVRYKERVIALDCFMEASGRADFVEKARRFLSLFDGGETHRLTVEYDGKAKPLVYEVSMPGEADLSKSWGARAGDAMVGTFRLKLTEDEPVKRVLRHTAMAGNSLATITIATPGLVNVHWGDGTHTYNVGGTGSATANVKHSYASAGTYDIIISGVIEDIQSLTTNASTVWQLLK